MRRVGTRKKRSGMRRWMSRMRRRRRRRRRMSRKSGEDEVEFGGSVMGWRRLVGTKGRVRRRESRLSRQRNGKDRVDEGSFGRGVRGGGLNTL